MSYEVRTISQIDNKNIKLGKTFKYSLGSDSNYNLTNIYYINSNAEIPKETESKKQDTLDDKTKLIIQTPHMYVPNSIIHFNDKPFIELSFNNEENDKDVLEFRKWITNLEDYIYKLIKKRTTLGITKDNLCSIVKGGYTGNINNSSNGGGTNGGNGGGSGGNSKSSSRLIVPINLNTSKCILNDSSIGNANISSSNGSKPKSMSKFLFNWEIAVPTYAISIIWVKNIWVKKGKWGLNLFMYASRVMNSHILDPVDFMGIDNDGGCIGGNGGNTNKTIKLNDVNKIFKEDNKNSIQIGDMPEYTMFFKMLKLGIPKPAVKQKMELQGLDTRLIDYPESAPYLTILHYISNPHLGPYVKNKDIHIDTNTTNMQMPQPPPIDGISSPIARPNLQLDLLKNIGGGGFKLKKIDKDAINAENALNKLNPAKNNMNNINNKNGLKVPTLLDITGALSKLKKIHIDKEEESHSDSDTESNSNN